jgi:hypothetical protein
MHTNTEALVLIPPIHAHVHTYIGLNLQTDPKQDAVKLLGKRIFPVISLYLKNQFSWL